MASTQIADIIVPDVFNPYIVQRTTELSALVRSGIVVPDPALDILAVRGGKLIEMPFFSDLSGADEVLSDSGALTPGKIGTGKDQARLLMRGKAWSVNDLAAALSGADPMKVVGDLVAEYWVRREQDVLIASLKGVFADNVANDAADLVHDISIADGNNAADANKISGTAVLDAVQKLGDMQEKLTAIAMHSVPYNRLLKQNLITFIPTADQKSAIPMYLGKEVIVDDAMPTVAGGTSGTVYTTYLFGRGAVGRGNGSVPVPTETDRDSLAGEDILINRRHFLLHIRGIKWTESSVAGQGPTNAELALAANYDRVYDKKLIRVVQLKSNG